MRDEIIRLSSTDSTHKFALKLAERKNRREYIIVADVQTNGVGRCGRRWTSVRGNLFMSAIKKLPKKENPGRLSLTIACAVHEALSVYVPNDLYLHWPNDIYYKKHKLSGILISMADDWAVISAGVNVNSNPGIINAISLKEICGEDIPTEKVLGNITEKLNLRLKELHVFGFGGIKNYWLRYINEINRTITVRNGSDSITGILEGIDDDGRLILERKCGKTVIFGGDIFENTKGSEL
ncbi:MAG: biotin--[acetyl-CoA-carboxylase] ligase [Holosporaceae bacterium]|nr:biotin--[acetyl-CoA-carboxylase] ligase [Holosporaceae bacterium]